MKEFDKDEIYFKIAPTGQAKCRTCEMIIPKGDIKLVYTYYWNIKTRKGGIYPKPCEKSICRTCAPKYLHKNVKNIDIILLGLQAADRMQQANHQAVKAFSEEVGVLHELRDKMVK